MKTRDEVKQALRDSISDNLPEVDAEALQEGTLLTEQAEVDSLGFIMVLTDLEDKLGVTIPDEEWPSLLSFGDVVDAFMSRLS